MTDAEMHFRRGEAHYERGEYAAAATAFHAAFDLTAEPMLLFNEAQAHRLASACRPARERYEQFLRLHPQNDATATLARQHLEQLASSCQELPPPPPVPVADTAPAPSVAAIEPAPPLPTHSEAPKTASSQNGGWKFAAAATVAFAGTAGAAWLWNQDQRERLTLDQQGLERVLPVAPGESSAQSRARHERIVDAQEDRVALVDTLTIGAAIAGGVALAVTLYLYLRRESGPKVETAGAAHHLLLTGRF